MIIGISGPSNVSDSQNENISDSLGQDVPRNSDGGQQYPWRRYWAKTFDLCCSMTVGLIILGITSSLAFSTNNYLIYRHLNDFQSVYQILFFIICESFLLSLFGTTLGKWLLSVYVRSSNKQVLNCSRAFLRSLCCMGVGCAFGIPPFSLVGLLYSRYRATQNQKMYWDIVAGSSVIVEQLRPLKVALFLFLFFFVALVPATVYGKY